MPGETNLVKIEDIDDSIVHELNVIEMNLCLYIVNGNMAKNEAAKHLGISKNKATIILNKPAVQKYIDLLKKKLTVNAIDNSLNQLRAVQGKAFNALMSKFDTPDHIRDLPSDATPDMIRDYYKSFALYTPIDKLHKIHSDATKIISDNSPESESKTVDEAKFEDRVRAKFHQKITKQKRLVEELHKRGIPASRFSEFGITDDVLIEIGKDDSAVQQTVPRNTSNDEEFDELDSVETIETTITVEGSLSDLSKLSLFDKNEE